MPVGFHSTLLLVHAVYLPMHAYGRLEVLIQWIEHLVNGREDFCDNVIDRLAMNV